MRVSPPSKFLLLIFLPRVKSLHAGGMGDIFDEVPRVDLMDMQQHLAAVKRLTRFDNY